MKTKIIGIYKITSPSGNIYIGQSKDIEKRWMIYRRYFAKSQARLDNSFKKYGIENHKFEIIEECSRESLNEREIYWIKFYDTFDTKHGMNLQGGGSSGSPSEETKKKIGLGNKGKILSSETKLKISNSHKGKIVSEETRKKISRGNIGKTKSEEHKKHISMMQKGRVVSEETRKKISIKLKHIPLSKERREKISKSARRGEFSIFHSKNRPKDLTEKIKKSKLKNGTNKVKEETKIKMSISHSGKIFSENHRFKIGLGNKGKVMSPESRQKIKDSWIQRRINIELKLEKSRKGEIVSSETREKMKKSQIQRRINEKSTNI